MRRPYSRRYKKRTYKRRRNYRRKTSVPRPLRNQHTMITRVCQMADFTVYSNYAWNSVQYSFRLIDLPAYSDFTNLFDKYKISAVKITFMPRWTGNDESNTLSTAAGLAVMANPVIFTSAAWDSTTHLSTQSSAFQTSRAKLVKNPWKPFSVYVKPRVPFETANGITVGGSASKRSWLDTDYPSVQHYGVEIGGRTYFTNAPLSSPNLVYDVFAKFYLQFSNAQ